MLASIPFTLAARAAGSGAYALLQNADPAQRLNVAMQTGFGFRIVKDTDAPGNYPIVVTIKDRKAGQERAIYVMDDGWHFVAEGFRSIDVTRVTLGSAEQWWLTFATDPSDYVEAGREGNASVANGGAGSSAYAYFTAAPSTTNNDPATAGVSAQSGGLSLNGVKGVRVLLEAYKSTPAAAYKDITGGEVRLWYSPYDVADPVVTEWGLALTGTLGSGPSAFATWRKTDTVLSVADALNNAGMIAFRDLEFTWKRGRLYAEMYDITAATATVCAVSLVGLYD